MADQVQCSTVRITVEREGGTVSFTVPSYTVGLSAFVTRAYSLLRTYVARSLEERQPMSLGDYALHVLSVAATDPRKQSHMTDSTTAIPTDVAATVAAAFRTADEGDR